jgi:hypothetical protein
LIWHRFHLPCTFATRYFFLSDLVERPSNAPPLLCKQFKQNMHLQDSTPSPLLDIHRDQKWTFWTSSLKSGSKIRFLAPRRLDEARVWGAERTFWVREHRRTRLNSRFDAESTPRYTSWSIVKFWTSSIQLRSRGFRGSPY